MSAPLRIVRRKTTYIDTCVLIAAYKAREAAHRAALAILDDTTRIFYAGDFLKMESLPALFRKDPRETTFYETFFDRATPLIVDSRVTQLALQIRCAEPLGFADALHVASAIVAGADEFITVENPGKPFHRLNGRSATKIVSICP